MDENENEVVGTLMGLLVVAAVIAAIAFHKEVGAFITDSFMQTTVECTDTHNADYSHTKTTCTVR